MNVTTDDLLLIIGAKEAELFALRKQVQELKNEIIALGIPPPIPPPDDR